MGAALSGVVQLAEHGSHNPDVVGSSPAPATNKNGGFPGGSNLSRFGVIQSQSRRALSLTKSNTYVQTRTHHRVRVRGGTRQVRNAQNVTHDNHFFHHRRYRPVLGAERRQNTNIMAELSLISVKETQYLPVELTEEETIDRSRSLAGLNQKRTATEAEKAANYIQQLKLDLTA